MILDAIELNISKAEFTISKLNGVNYKSNIGNFAKHLKLNDLSIEEYTRKYYPNLLPICLETGESSDNKLIGYWNKYIPLKKCFSQLYRYVKTTSNTYNRIRANEPEYWCDELTFEYWIDKGYRLSDALIRLRFFYSENRDLAYYQRLNINSPFYSDWAVDSIDIYKRSILDMQPLELKPKWSKDGAKQRGISSQTFTSFYKTKSSIFRDIDVQTSMSIRAHKKHPNWKLNSVRCVDFWVSRGYSYEYAIDVISKLQQTNSLDNISNRFNCSKLEAKIIQSEIYQKRASTMASKSADELREIYSKQDSASFKYCMLKCNNDVYEATNLFSELKQRRTVAFGVASKESLLYFIPLYKQLRRSGIRRESMYLGVGGSREYFISYNNLFFMYDFTILNKKLIIEYDGAYWHRNTQEYDAIKDVAAINNGFKILRISSNDDFNTNNNKIKQFIDENI